MKKRKSFILFCLISLAVSNLLMAQQPSEISITNPSFENSTTGWSNGSTGDWEYFAPVEGTNYGKVNGGSNISQVTNESIQSGKTYTLTVWTRSLLIESYLQYLQNPSGSWPSGTSATTIANVELFAGSTTLVSASQQVNPKALSGAPASYSADDGCNVWIDGNYRMAFTGDNTHFYQTIDKDPINDPWLSFNDSDFHGGDMAYGQIITTQGLKAVYPTFYDEGSNVSVISMSKVTGGSAPDYSWSNPVEVLGNFIDSDPWVLDAHLYQDDDDKLYMSWGGQPFYVTEMDPSTGMVKGNPSSIEFDDHPVGTHVAVANWNGDEWTDGNDWFEGPCIYKHGGYYYLFGSYGNLGINYTIRMGRGTSPTGPFYDKQGRDLNSYDSGDQEYGNSFLLGDDGNQVVPGHPHIWEENGKHYLGYDYRYQKDPEDITSDYNGIRQIYFENGWPTIWTPITVAFNADDYPSLVGQQLGIRVTNNGTSGSILGVDQVSLVSEGVTQYTLTTSATPGGSVTAGGTYDAGTVVSIAATPDADYQFDGWSGDASGTSNPLSVTIDANISITANFSSSGGASFPTNAKIMPLGASRTEGDRPVFESHRYELWKNMLDNGWTFDYVGNEYDNASHPTHLGQAFDEDHEGHGGFTSGDLLAGVNKWIVLTGAPDIVFFSAPGGNDALENLPISNTLDNINSIIDVIQSNNPDVTIFIEQLAPAHSSIMTPTLTDYIDQLVAEMPIIAAEQTTATSNVIPVDLNTGWLDSYFADDVHYNGAGAKEAADRYVAVMKTFYSAGDTATYTLTTNASPGGSDLVIYPNPTHSDVLNIRANNLRGETHITLSDLSGKMAFSETINITGDTDIKIDISGLKRGFYLVNAKSSVGNVCNKVFIK